MNTKYELSINTHLLDCRASCDLARLRHSVRLIKETNVYLAKIISRTSTLPQLLFGAGNFVIGALFLTGRGIAVHAYDARQWRMATRSRRTPTVLTELVQRHMVGPSCFIGRGVD